MAPMNRSSLPGFALAFVVLVASVVALLLGGGLAARPDDRGVSLRPAVSSQPVRLAAPIPTPAQQR
jgi:hypothetical protein